jgi:hypothetical protein
MLLLRHELAKSSIMHRERHAARIPKAMHKDPDHPRVPIQTFSFNIIEPSGVRPITRVAPSKVLQAKRGR